MSEDVLSGTLGGGIWFYIMLRILDHIVFPGVRVGIILILIDESFSVSIIGVWSEDRSADFRSLVLR
jgi:hypothetical protein